jgi:hypothetical protein
MDRNMPNLPKIKAAMPGFGRKASLCCASGTTIFLLDRSK